MMLNTRPFERSHALLPWLGWFGCALVPLWAAWQGDFGLASLHHDNRWQNLPLFAEVLRQVFEGDFPAYSLGMWGGYPLFAQQQAHVLYAPTYLFLPLTHNPELAFELFNLLHLLWLAGGWAWLLRGWGYDRDLGFYIGIAAGSTGMAVSGLLFWNDALVALAWWPWVLGSLRRLLIAPPGQRYRPLAWAAVSIAMMFLGGHPQIFLIAMLLAPLLGVAMSHSGLTALRFQGWLLVCGLLAALLTAAQWMPTLELLRAGLRGTPRSLDEFAALSVELNVGVWHDLLWPGAAGNAPSVLLPHAPFNLLYLGLPTFLLALIGMIQGAHALRLWAGLAIGCGLLLSWQPLQVWWHEIPGVALFRYPVKWWLLVTCGALLLAGAGAQWLRQQWPRLSVWLLPGFAGLSLLLGGYHFQGQLAAIAGSEEQRRQEDAASLAASPIPRLILRPDAGLLRPVPIGNAGLLIWPGLRQWGGTGPFATQSVAAAGLFDPAREGFLQPAHLATIARGVGLLGGALQLPTSSLDGIALPFWIKRQDHSEWALLTSELPELRFVTGDPARSQLLESQHQEPSAQLQLNSLQSSRIQLSYATDQPGLIVTRRLWVPGWQAWRETASGRSSVPVHAADGFLLAAEIPADAGRITLEYRPAGLLPGLLGSMLGLLALGLAFTRPSIHR